MNLPASFPVAARALLRIAPFFFLLGISEPQAVPAPHIIMLLADDLGWNDVGYHGSEIQTPNIDSLASSGVELNQFYVMPVCTSTRASFLTGRYPFRSGLGKAPDGLPLKERTIAEALGERGYRTAILGKWHMGYSSPERLPTQRGFDRQYGHYRGFIDYFAHTWKKKKDWHRNDRPLVQKGYATSLIAEEAATLVRQHDRDVPLFLYVPFNAPHSPIQAPKGAFDSSEDQPIPRRRVFGAMVSALDSAVGKIVAALEERGMRGNSLILFASDNGGYPLKGSDNSPLRGEKLQTYEGGIRVVSLANWPGVIEPGSLTDEAIHIVDLYPTLLNLAGGSLQTEAVLDGVDAWSVISKGAPSKREEMVFGDVAGEWAALRRGDWKLVVNCGADLSNGEPVHVRRLELFNIKNDPHELKDLFALEVKRAAALEARLQEYAKDSPEGRHAGMDAFTCAEPRDKQVAPKSQRKG